MPARLRHPWRAGRFPGERFGDRTIQFPSGAWKLETPTSQAVMVREVASQKTGFFRKYDSFAMWQAIAA